MKDIEYNRPNTRARINARRASRKGKRPSGSQVRPGLVRSMGGWVSSGRLLSLVLFLGSIGALWSLFTSDRYHIQQIEVRGNRALEAGAVASLSGLRGVPIWFADAAGAANRLLTSAYVERAAVEIVLPDRAVVTLTERQPDIRWELGGVQYLVDNTGKVLEAAREPAQPGTLVIKDTRCTNGIPCANIQPNDQIDPDALELARRLVLRLPEDLKLTPASIGWDMGVGVFVTTSSAQTIVFGQTDNLERKLSILSFILQDQTPFTFLDLRPENPYYRGGPQLTPTPTDQ